MSESPPSTDRILDLLDGRLPEPERAAVLAAVDGDPDARRLADLYRIARTTHAADDSVPVSADLLARLKSIGPAPAPAGGFQRAWEAAAEAFDGFSQSLAGLLHDSRRPGMGLRGATAAVPGQAFHAAWADGDVEIDLQATPAADDPARPPAAWTLLGQVAGDQAVDGMPVRLVPVGPDGGPAEDGRTPVDLVTDGTGVFESTVASGAWAVLVRLEEQVVVIDRLDLAG